MLKPFAPPPPSSFGVLPACTVSLSDPLFLFPFLIKNPCGREGKTQTGVTSRGLFGGVDTAACCNFNDKNGEESEKLAGFRGKFVSIINIRRKSH